MASPKVVFLDRATIPPHIHLPVLPFEHQWVEYDYTTARQAPERVQGADIVITNKVVLDASVLATAPSVRMIAVSATGYNNVDIDYCRQHQIAVTNVQGYATRSVPEHVIAMIFALKRNLLGYHHDIAAGVWQKDKQFCFFSHTIGDVAGSCLGIIGGGTLGQATAALAQAVGMRVVMAEHKGESECRAGYVPFEQVVSQADIISLHCPLTSETRNLIAAAELNKMQPSAILINTGRGGLVNEQDLVNALRHGDIAAAGVDVFTAEPADKTNPLLAAMDELPNLLLTPHVAWGSDSAISQLATILMDNVRAFVAGEQQNRVV